MFYSDCYSICRDKPTLTKVLGKLSRFDTIFQTNVFPTETFFLGQNIIWIKIRDISIHWSNFRGHFCLYISYTEGLNPITYFCEPVKPKEHFPKIIRWYLFNLSSNNCVVVTAALKRVLISRWSDFHTSEAGTWGEQQKHLPYRLDHHIYHESSCNLSQIEWSGSEVREGILKSEHQRKAIEVILSLRKS